MKLDIRDDFGLSSVKVADTQEERQECIKQAHEKARELARKVRECSLNERNNSR